MGDNDLDLDEVLEDDGKEDGDESSSDEEQGTDQAPADDPKDKRINDLMSKWQKADAELKQLKAEPSLVGKGAPSKGAKDAGSNPELQQWIELARAQARDQIYGSDPRFGEFSLDRGSITGTTPAEMTDSARRLSELLDKVETAIEGKALKRHGLSPETRASAPAKGQKSYDDMSPEEFEKALAKAKSSF